MWGSNPRPSAHKTDALPTELTRQIAHALTITRIFCYFHLNIFKPNIPKYKHNHLISFLADHPRYSVIAVLPMSV